jgi:flagellin-like protein
MMTMKNNTIRILRYRKAVSPLIATVLLIAFAVALGAVVMNWGRGYVEDTANIARERSDTEVTCASEVDINIVDIDSVPQICHNETDNKTIYFIVENKQSRTVEKIQARLIGDATRVPYTIDLGDDSNLTMNAAKLLNFTYDDTVYGDPIQLKLTPYIKVGGSEVSCPSSAETETNIKPCAEIWD